MKSFLLILLFLFSVAQGIAQGEPKLIAEDIQNAEKIVTGAPFTAEAVITSIQVLANGTRISHTAQSKLYRDAMGRFRRDSSRQQLNIPGANVELLESILIIDPVAGYRYSLNTNERTFRRYDTKETGEKMSVNSKSNHSRTEESSTIIQSNSNMTSSTSSSSNSNSSSNNESQVETSSADNAPKGRRETGNNTSGLTNAEGVSIKKESLGTRIIEGLNTDGMLTTATIHAGAIGNDRPLTLVYESWFSKEIMMIVLSKRIDPRFGEQEYQLTNISRAPPPLSVFSPPTDYTRESGKRERPNKKRNP